MLENLADLSITIVIWTSDNNRSYLTVTGHFYLMIVYIHPF